MSPSRPGISQALTFAAIAAIAIGLIGFGFEASSLPDRVNATIPSAQIEHVEGFLYRWQVPPPLRRAPWYRADLMIHEDGRLLRSRVEDQQLIAERGRGLFGAAPFSVGAEESAFVWLSSSDNSDPRSNGRRYEFLTTPAASNQIFLWSMAAGLLILGLQTVTSAARQLYRIVTVRGVPSLGQRRLAMLFLFLIASALQVYSWTRGINATIGIAPATVIETHDGAFAFRLPRRVPPRVFEAHGTVHEDNRPLRWVGRSAWSRTSDFGVFSDSAASPVLVRVRSAAGISPVNADRKYSVAFPIIPAEVAAFLAVISAGLALSLLLAGQRISEMRRSHHDITEFGRRVARWYNRSGWKWALFAAAIAKIWFVAGLEIIARDYDAHGYARSSLSLVFGAGSLATHPGGFPIVAGIVGQFGVPWRLAVEIFYLLLCAGLAVASRRIGFGQFTAFLIFAAMAWHPYTIPGFGDFMSDPIVLLISLGLTAFALNVLSQPSSEWRGRIFVGVGLLLFLWLWAREEDPLVYWNYMIFALFAYWVTAQESPLSTKKRRLYLLAIPVLVAFPLISAVKFTNYLRYGVYAKSRVSQPGLMQLMSALYRVKPTSQLRYAPVTRGTLDVVSAASPTLRAYRTPLLDPGNANVRFGEAITKEKGEFGPWLNWVIPSSLPRDPVEVNRTMKTAAAEIDSMLRDGSLPRRLAYFPIDPQWRLWVPDLLPSLLTSLRAGTSIEGQVTSERRTPRQETGNPEIRYTFDLAANRRAATVYQREHPSDPPPVNRPTLGTVDYMTTRVEVLCKALTMLALLSAFISFCRRGSASQRLLLASAGVSLAWLISRSGLFALLNATVGWGTYRYMQPTSPLFIATAILVAALAGTFARRLLIRIDLIREV